jgi:hypothetical protein
VERGLRPSGTHLIQSMLLVTKVLIAGVDQNCLITVTDCLDNGRRPCESCLWAFPQDRNSLDSELLLQDTVKTGWLTLAVGVGWDFAAGERRPSVGSPA